MVLKGLDIQGKNKDSYLKTSTKNKFQVNCRSKWEE